MPTAPGDATPEGGPSAAGSAREDAAKLLVTGYVDKVVEETKTWLDESAEAFTTCLDLALTSSYSADRLVKDTAEMWARNLKYLVSLAAVGPPTSRPGQPGTAAGSRET